MRLAEPSETANTDLMHQINNAEMPDSDWKGLYRLGHVAVWVMLLIFRRWLSSEFMLLRMLGVIRVGPKAIPTLAVDWFTLLHDHPLIGLTLLNAFDMVNFALVGLIVLALCAALRRTDRGFMAIALVLSFAGIAVYIASNPAFSMLTLSQQYAAATKDAQRSQLLSKAQALLATKNPAAVGQNVAFVFINVAGLIISTLMLRSGVFSRATAWMGLLHNAIALGYPIGVALAPGIPAIPGAAWIISVFFWVLWYIGIAGTLRRLGSAC